MVLNRHVYQHRSFFKTVVLPIRSKAIFNSLLHIEIYITYQYNDDILSPTGIGFKLSDQTLEF
jgi:hypothetical protein